MLARLLKNVLLLPDERMFFTNIDLSTLCDTVSYYGYNNYKIAG